MSRRIVGVYFLFATAWIVMSDLALLELTKDLPTFAGASLIKGGVFVLVTCVLLYLLVSHYFRSRVESGSFVPHATLPRRSGLGPLTAFSTFVVLTVVLVLMMFSYQSRQHHEEEHNDLRAILELKADQLELLLAQRQATALSYSRSRDLRDDLTRLAQRPDPSIAPDIRNRIEQLQHDLAFDAVLVLDTAGKVIAGAGPEELRQFSPEFTAQAARSIASGTPVANYLHRDVQSPGEPVLLDFITPLPATSDDKKIVGAIVLRENARNRLFRLIGNWPTPSPTGETLLVRRDGDQVLFLNDVRHIKYTAFRLRRPMSETDLPAVKAMSSAAAATSHMDEGKDYRGVDVVSVSRAIAGTDWYMIAKLDRDEILAPVRRSTITWLASILSMTLIGAAGIGFLWRQQILLAATREQLESVGRRRAENKLSAAEERYRALFERSLDCIFLADLEGNFLDANHAALDLLGYRREEIPSISYRTLLDATDFPRAIASLQDVIRTGTQRELSEYALRRKDGRKVIVEIKSVLVYEEGKPGAILGIARDITDRKQAQRELEFKNTVLSTQRQTSPDAILVVDEGGRIISYNQKFLELWNIPEEMVRTGADEPVLQAVVAQMRNPDEFINKVKHLYETRAEKSHDELQTKDGRTIDRHSAPMTGYGGEYYGRVWYFRDITERRRNELALAESESRFRRMAETIGEVFWMTPPDGSSIVYVSPAFEKIWGWSCEALYAAPELWMKAIHPEDTPNVLASLKRVADGGTYDIEFRITHRDGSLRWISDRGYAIRDGTGRVILITGVATDITERKRSELDLRESEQRFRAMIEQSISGFYMIQDDRFTYVNSRFTEIFGYASPDEIVGKRPSELIAPKDRATVAANIQRRLEGKVKSVSYSFAGQRKDGSEIEVGVHGSLAVYQGKPVIMGLLQDISERKRAEEEIKRYVARLEQAMQSTINVVATIGELRDPYTHGHERRVGEIAAAIATEMGLENNQVEGIRIAGYLHDVGKIAVPAEILAKPAKLTRAEFDLVKDHAQQSYEILKSVQFPWPVAEAAWQHHERLDGSGYPRGLKGEEIIREARILAVADTVEAMSSHRPYRPGLGLDKALAEIEKNRGRLYDPGVVDACLRLFREKGYLIPA